MDSNIIVETVKEHKQIRLRKFYTPSFGLKFAVDSNIVYMDRGNIKSDKSFDWYTDQAEAEKSFNSKVKAQIKAGYPK